MIKKILMALGLSLGATASATAADFYKPYAEPHVNFLYNLLFCDDLTLFRNENTSKGKGLWSTLLADKPDLSSLQKIAEDESVEGRVRAIAFNRLRASGRQVPKKKILGVIIEVPQKGGLDVLAAFAEGGVRYLNQSGKVAVFEGDGHPAETLAKELVAVAQPVVNQIGPWEKNRLAPPQLGNVRLTFLVSDGLYFGEGPFGILQKEALAGPVLSSATSLLQFVVGSATK